MLRLCSPTISKVASDEQQLGGSLWGGPMGGLEQSVVTTCVVEKGGERTAAQILPHSIPVVGEV